jgi:4'-phosphopantetheinyl transferase
MDELQQIDVWTVDLDAPADSCASLLSEDERARAARYHFDIHRRRFICGRAALRILLGEYLDAEPSEVEFGYAGNEKPFLRNSTVPVSFNVAHCEGLALIAIAPFEMDLGVDVEQVRWMPDFDELVGRFFSKREADSFVALEPQLKPAAFFNLWTRKEALLKATGEGICDALNRVEVTFLPGEPARLLSLPHGSVLDWTVRDFVPAEGFAGALVARSPGFRFDLMSFELEQHLTLKEIA